MAVKPLEDRILIKPLEAEKKTTAGIYLPESAKEKPMQGKVVALGPGKLLDNGERVRPAVKKMCDVLGFDPLTIPCEGRFVCCVDGKDAVKVKKAMGPQARIIGRVTGSHRGEVHLFTRVGAGRLLPMLEQDQLPRIC